MYLQLVGADRYAAKFLALQGKTVQRGDIFEVEDSDGERLLRERPGKFKQMVLCARCEAFVAAQDIVGKFCQQCSEKIEKERKEKEERRRLEEEEKAKKTRVVRKPARSKSTEDKRDEK